MKQAIQTDPKLVSLFIGDVIRYSNQATTRRAGYLLDTLGIPTRQLNRLQRELTDSRALIPWIPGRSGKGSINRRWGVIVNG